MIVTLSLTAAGAEVAPLEPVGRVIEAAIDEVIDSSTDGGTVYEVLSKLAQGVFPRIACPHLVNPRGQQTGSMSTMSLGHTVRGAWLNIEMTPVGVRERPIAVAVEWSLCFDSGVVISGAVRANDGQHSGRSSEQPIKGTSIKWPSLYWSAVYSGIVHVPVNRDCPE